MYQVRLSKDLRVRSTESESHLSVAVLATFFSFLHKFLQKFYVLCFRYQFSAFLPSKVLRLANSMQYSEFVSVSHTLKSLKVTSLSLRALPCFTKQILFSNTLAYRVQKIKRSAEPDLSVSF